MGLIGDGFGITQAAHLGERGVAILTGRWRAPSNESPAALRKIADIAKATLALTRFEYSYTI